MAKWRREELEAEHHDLLRQAVDDSPTDTGPMPQRHALTKPGDPVKARGIPLILEGGIGGKVTSSDPLRTCFRCGRPPFGRRPCRCR